MSLHTRTLERFVRKIRRNHSSESDDTADTVELLQGLSDEDELWARSDSHHDLKELHQSMTSITLDETNGSSSQGLDLYSSWASLDLDDDSLRGTRLSQSGPCRLERTSRPSYRRSSSKGSLHRRRGRRPSRKNLDKAADPLGNDSTHRSKKITDDESLDCSTHYSSMRSLPSILGDTDASTGSEVEFAAEYSLPAMFEALSARP